MAVSASGAVSAAYVTPARDPSPELPFRADAGVVDPQPAVHRAAAHLEPTDMFTTDQPFGLVRVDTDEEATLPAGAHRHVAADEEREPAEHAPLG